MPVTGMNAASIDFENRTLNAGLVTGTQLKARVWLDNTDGVLGPGDGGVAGVTVQLLGSESRSSPLK